MRVLPPSRDEPRRECVRDVMCMGSGGTAPWHDVTPVRLGLSLGLLISQGIIEIEAIVGSRSNRESFYSYLSTRNIPNECFFVPLLGSSSWCFCLLISMEFHDRSLAWDTFSLLCRVVPGHPQSSILHTQEVGQQASGTDAFICDTYLGVPGD